MLGTNASMALATLCHAPICCVMFCCLALAHYTRSDSLTGQHVLCRAVLRCVVLPGTCSSHKISDSLTGQLVLCCCAVLCCAVLCCGDVPGLMCLTWQLGLQGGLVLCATIMVMCMGLPLALVVFPAHFFRSVLSLYDNLSCLDCTSVDFFKSLLHYLRNQSPVAAAAAVPCCTVFHVPYACA